MKKKQQAYSVCYTAVFSVVSLSTDAAKNSNIPCVGSPEYSMQSDLIDHSGWTRVIGKILALNQRHFDNEKSYVPSGIIFDWLYSCTGPVHRLVFAINTGF